MKHRTVRICSNCGNERPRDYHCISCNAIGRATKHRFIFQIGWRPPTREEVKGVPLHERELIKEPTEW